MLSILNVYNSLQLLTSSSQSIPSSSPPSGNHKFVLYVCESVSDSCVRAQLLQLFWALCDPKDCNSPGSSVHGILQVRKGSALPCPPSRDLPDPGIKPLSLTSPALADGFLTTVATCEAHFCFIDRFFCVIHIKFIFKCCNKILFILIIGLLTVCTCRVSTSFISHSS